jgi:hypothetical protein
MTGEALTEQGQQENQAEEQTQAIVSQGCFHG